MKEIIAYLRKVATKGDEDTKAILALSNRYSQR